MGTKLTRQAWHLLEADAKTLGLPDLHIRPISDFLDTAEQHRTSVADRQAIIDQATLMFDHLYPHMPFKRNIYRFTHPSDFLRTEVQPALEFMSEIDFHTGVLDAFSRVRDAHTLYGLPSPYRGAIAFLPFQIRPFLDQKRGWRFIVTSIMNTQPDGNAAYPNFEVGCEVVGWSDLNTLAHIERTEAHLSGGNYFAGLTRGAIHSTLRPLTYVQAPFLDEVPSVTIRYRPLDGGLNETDTRAIAIPWAVATGFGQAGGFPCTAFSVSPAAAIAKACGRMMHRRDELRNHRDAAEAQDPNAVSSIPQMFGFQYTGGPREVGSIDLEHLVDEDQPDARFGYINISTFSDGSSSPGSTDRIVNEFQRIVALMDKVAPDGLIIDIRSNPGGDVQAAERMLQMLTPRRIEPIHFHLANTSAVQAVLRSLKTESASLSAEDAVKLSQARAELEAWIEDADHPPLPKGSALTSGRPLTDPDRANAIGQIYQGRGVALLINSLTYSAADIFAAGFQDHSIGVMIGTSMVTGGGGANVWSHADLLNKLGPTPGVALAELPGDASMSLAIRRCSRVGGSKGQAVEDQGVKVDVVYWTEDVGDLIAGNAGILRRACKELAHNGVFRVDADSATQNNDGSITVAVTTTNIKTLKFYINGQLSLTANSKNAIQTFTVPAGSSTPSFLRIEGYAHNPQRHGLTTLMRSRVILLRKPVAAESFDPATDSITGTVE